MTAIYPVVLCGGSGTRLWPSSRPDQPKQFLKLVGERSSFQETLLRVKDLDGARECVVVTGAAMAEMVEQQAAEINVPLTVIIEPEARDSGPAIAAAAAYVRTRDVDGVILMLAADHYIAEPDLFREAAGVAVAAATKDYLVTFGVKPTAPATGFGYIRAGALLMDGVHAVDAFVEKPDLATALRYMAEDYVWNSGNFAFFARVLLDEMLAFEPDIAQSAVASVETATFEDGRIYLGAEAFSRASKKSLDYSVMERTQRAAVAPATFTWSDLGAWDAIWEISSRDEDHNVVQGDVHLMGCSGVLARSTRPFVGAIGVSDLMIVAEPDAVLVCRRQDAQHVKALVDFLKHQDRSIAHRHGVSNRKGVARETLSQANGHAIEMWRLGAGAATVLPIGTLQVLEGSLSQSDQIWTESFTKSIDEPVSVRAESPAVLLITAKAAVG
ncbi:mannose-1-phosphate guanylyltransferase/mannose-6-phosphate isomerase [Caulobacter sp. D4A]|uniref:mannose-1-phosphate guanylyltransferase/mannose-6-phosphate isomerase n=1 Tax=unclassified Caulobacter TaxID=2648921 RepID=UPI000D73DF64|nr:MULTISPECIES: mannose-1-phosphate guanylyltransferase/mannose-6-phosphate isomerase [unclassified Caulobacter]PXA83993.1 mannose-1-phosphate guanylyltransferase/mannose-6-phosphate isomerase [Caulobacter sp. D4A]PXA92254.1 mannose-1-phosphate guanylyltransferase/mannose-6-phosphate isomerase [Caulobacter sp. D5]